MKKERNKMVFCSKAGFTLIELLVVVLIIGILAAVALPQYNKAVEKARTREAVLMIRNMQHAFELCRLQYGDGADECGPGEDGLFSRMDIEMPGTIVEDDYCDNALGCYVTKDWAYDYDGSDFYIVRISDPDDIAAGRIYTLQAGTSPGSDIRCNSGTCNGVCATSGCVLP